MQQLITLGILVSLFALVFALGLRATSGDLLYLARRPGLLARSILSMNVVMLALAILIVTTFPLAIEIKIALVALALSPVPPILPGKQTKAGGTQSFAVSLLIAASLLAIVLIPIGIEIVSMVMGADYRMPMAQIVPPVAISVIVPLLLGRCVGWLMPEVAEKIAHPVSRFATMLLLVACIPVLIVTGATFWTQVGNGVVLFLAIFTIVGLAAGHFLGGPDEGNRTVLALATGTRHPGVAMAIAALNFPDQKAAVAVMLWHLVIGAIVSIPYVRWRKAQRRRAEASGV